jgi:hypothetical protein
LKKKLKEKDIFIKSLSNSTDQEVFVPKEPEAISKKAEACMEAATLNEELHYFVTS